MALFWAVLFSIYKTEIGQVRLLDDGIAGGAAAAGRGAGVAGGGGWGGGATRQSEWRRKDEVR